MMMMMMTMTIMNSYRIHADNPYQQQNEIMFTKNNFWRIELVEASWNVMARAQKTDFIIRQNGRVHLSRRRRQFSRLLADEVCASALVMLDTPCSEVVWRVLATHSIRQFPLHFPSRASLPSHFNWSLLPCGSESSQPSPFLLLVNYDIWSRPDTYSFPRWYGTLDVVLRTASSHFHVKKFLLKFLTSYQTARYRSPENHLWKYKSNLHTAVTGYIVIVSPDVPFPGGGILINTR
jgi:hypothetical protein